MKFATKSTSGTRSFADRSQAGFTLAEVLAALLFMGIVIPVALEGLRVASLAGEVAERKLQASRVAERLLNESLIVTNWSRAMQKGTIEERGRQFQWVVRGETWSQDGTMYAPRLLSAEVTYKVQDRDYRLTLTTLTPHTLPQ
jgi:type II secretory pathway pseudopilin PulG